MKLANTKYVTYFRVSTVRQGESKLGLEAQEKAVLSWLRGKDWEVVGSYTDVESGTRKGNSRPELAKALIACKREKATLVIAKIDRLSRNVAFIANLMEAGVDFVAVDLPQANRLTIHILAAVAEDEADRISDRTKKALQAAKDRGVKLGTPENLTDDARLKGAAATRDKAIRSYGHIPQVVAELKASGLSFRAISQTLNARGYLGRQGLPFTAMTVKRIFDRQNG
jgi:DNA invertase Pin-like site-specific DNA recombinase